MRVHGIIGPAFAYDDLFIGVGILLCFMIIAVDISEVFSRTTYFRLTTSYFI